MWDNFYAFCTTVHKKFHTHIYERGKNGGAEENRTPVRKPIRRPFYTLSEVFVVSLILLRLTGSALGSPLMC